MNKMIFTVGLLIMSLVVTLVFADGLFNDRDAPAVEKASGVTEEAPQPISGMFTTPPAAETPQPETPQ